MRELAQLMAGETLHLPDERWRAMLETADRNQSTPCLPPSGPQWFQEAVAERNGKVQLRRPRVMETYRDAAAALERSGVEFVLIKGLSHEADAAWAPGQRAQNDIDLLVRPGAMEAAEAALLAAGFVFHPGAELSDNHGRPLLKPHSWQWRGDYFDPELPVSIELHHTIWSDSRDRLPVGGATIFWDRCEEFPMGGRVFQDADRLGIATLHLLRHILRNNLRLAHAFEVSRMMRHLDAAAWKRWEHHSAELRQLESIAMKFASVWFGAPLPGAARVSWESLPRTVHRWMEAHAFAPVDNLESPNKQVLWLHLALLPRWQDRVAVARRRLLPRLPSREQAADPGHLWARGRYHAVALARLIGSGARSTARSMASHTSD